MNMIEIHSATFSLNIQYKGQRGGGGGGGQAISR